MKTSKTHTFLAPVWMVRSGCVLVSCLCHACFGKDMFITFHYIPQLRKGDSQQENETYYCKNAKQLQKTCMKFNETKHVYLKKNWHRPWLLWNLSTCIYFHAQIVQNIRWSDMSWNGRMGPYKVELGHLETRTARSTFLVTFGSQIRWLQQEELLDRSQSAPQNFKMILTHVSNFQLEKKKSTQNSQHNFNFHLLYKLFVSYKTKEDHWYIHRSHPTISFFELP